MKTYHAVLIDPHARTVTDVELPGEGDAYFDEAKRLVGCKYLEATRLDHDVIGWCDEEGMLMDWDHQAFFRIGPHDRCYAGRMVLMRSPRGRDEVGSLPIGAEAIATVVHWVEPRDVRVPAPRLVVLGPGQPSTELLAGREEWDYEHQPTGTPNE